MAVTAEDIKKAKEILGLVKAEGKKEDDINKAEKMSIEKAEILKSEYKELLKKAEAIKVELEEAGHKMGPTDGDDSEILSHKKAETTDINKGENKEDKTSDVLMKAMDEKFTSLSTLIVAKEEENKELKKALEDLSTKVEAIGKSSNGPRSITAQNFKERFPKTEGGEVVMSKSRDRRALTAELTKAAKFGEGHENDIFAKAASLMEVAGEIGRTEQESYLVAQKVFNDLKIKITA